VNRLRGLLLIIRALTPLLIVILLAAALMIMVRDLRQALAVPVQRIQTEFTGVRTAIDNARTDAEGVVNNVTTVVNRLQSFNLANLIPDIPTNIRLPSLQLPPLTLTVPYDLEIRYSSVNIGVTISYPSGVTVRTRNVTVTLPSISNIDIPVPGLSGLVTALRNALRPVTEIFNIFTPAFSSINRLSTTLKQFPDHLRAIVDQGQSVVSGIQDIITRWENTLVVVGVVLLALVMIYYVVPTIDDFNRGLRLLRGLSVN
jgi:hypothetical protein